MVFLQDRTWSECVHQFSIPDAGNLQFVPNRLNITLHFTSPSWVTVSDGTGRLYLLQSGDRRTGEQWKVIMFKLYTDLLISCFYLLDCADQ